MKVSSLTGILIPALSVFLSAQAPAFEKLPDGVVVTLEKEKPTDARKVKIQVCTENIIRVTATPGDDFSTRPSLMIDKTELEPVKWSAKEKGGDVIVSTPGLIIRVNAKSGAVAFFDKEGLPVLREKSSGGKSIMPAEVMGEQTYHIRQIFESPEDEAFYGLGQHQNAVMNYRGHDVDLLQHNIVAVVPFLVSSRNYGILWDNNSRTKFSDPRDFLSLSALRLIDRTGQPGGLTAEYFLDAGFDSLFTFRREPRIEHEFTDVNDEFPDGFRRNVRAVRWSGEIEADQTGIHKLRLYCSGYTRMWINGEQVLDNWRQNWLPWTHHYRLNLKAGEKASIRIDWIPGGGFIGLTCLPPAEDPGENALSLYSEVADQIDYYFIRGDNADQVIHGYRAVTGKAPMMPKWAMGLWQCRERYQTQEQLLDVVKEFRKKRIPFDNIVQDWFYWLEDKWGDHDFDASRYPDPEGMVRELHQDLSAHIMISVWPKFYVGTRNYEAFRVKGWLYMRNVEQEQRDWVGRGYVSTFYDPYSQGARDLFWKQMDEKLFSKGLDAWWLDATEPDIQSNLSREETLLRIGPTALGTAARYLNSYSLMNAKGVYEGQRQSNPEKRVFILTRSAFAGQQRYSAATWSGDIATRWYDLKAQIPAGLNFGLSGIPYWTTDIGGFAVEPRFERNVKPEDLEEWREFNTRWFQFGAFCPLFRVHGQFPYREMFNIAPDDHPAYQAMLAYDHLRYRLMPYIYSLAGMVTHEDYTIMRGLVMDFGKDKNVLGIGDQFMFGPFLLVNPVTEYRARTRPVYLPVGCGWYGLKSGAYFEGGRTIEAEAPYLDIPLFVREGSILPFGPEIQYADEKPADPLRLVLYTGRDCSFTLYEDENVNYNYEKGAFSRIPLSWDESKKSLTIGKRQGEFPGMLQKRAIEIVWVKKDGKRGLDLDAAPDESVVYDGSKKVVRMK